MAKDKNAPGRVLAGRYRLEKKLGEGGFGTVWQAHHLILEAPVALKLIDPEIAEDEVAVERFLREAKAAASLRSPHVVQILDHGVDDGQPFMAMELLEGETLAQRIKRGGRIDAGETVRILGQVARAIGRAHEAGVVHRDLKPENIFLVSNDDDEIAKVLDFGVAKLDGSKLGMGSTATRTGSLLGTPFYMSPEQVLGNKEVDYRSDLWSMGVIAFEMMTGKRPFVSEGLGDLVLRITVRPLPVPSQFAPVAAGFDSWFERAMAREPASRFASARELVETLRDALELGADAADAVVTVPEPDEDPLPVLETSPSGGGRGSAITPTRRVDVSNAPTVLVGAGANEPAEVATTDAPRGSSGGRATSSATGLASSSARSSPGEGDASTVSQFATPAGPTAHTRSPALAVGVAFGALALGLVGGLAALGLRDDERPLPAVGAEAPGALLPADRGPVRKLAPTAPPAAPLTEDEAALVASASADPSAGETEERPDPELAGPEASAAAGPSVSGDPGPPPEWLPREIDGRIVKPDWAMPDPEPLPPPPPPSPPSPPPSPYD